MDLTTVFLIAGASFLAGLLLAGLFSALFSKKPPSETKPATSDPERASVPTPPAGSGLLISWSPTGKAPTIQLDGREVRDPAELGLRGQAWMDEVLKSLQEWISPAPLPATPPDLAAASTEWADTPRPRFSPVDTLVKAVSTEVPAALPNKSIAAQVEEVLQKRLEGTPLAERGIHLVEGPGGAVEIKVGLDRYAGIDALPDGEIKSAIRAAVAEWSQKSIKK